MLRLHHLPEHIAQKEQKIQYQLVATLGLLAMFTHENLFWIAGLVLTMIDLPDFVGLLNRIASSVERIAWRVRPGTTAPAHQPGEPF
jgi:type III secretory pathway component EscT